VRYNIYYSDQADNEVFIDSIGDSGNAQTSYTDEGKSAPNTVLAAPIDDTTGGPVLGQISYSDNRVFGTKDPNNPYRVYWGGVGNNTTAFSSFFGGGWVDIGRGGGEIPSKVQSYQNGKGEAINTVFMIDAGSTGSQTQITLSTMTVGTTTFIVPMIARVIGSLGTPAPDSIIEAKNNLWYMNTQGVYTTGMKPELLNSLSTDEVALAIRDEIRRINNQYANKISGAEYEGKLFFALPYGNSENSTVAVLDLALKSWMWGWNLPVKKFISYTGSDGVQRLLYRPSGAAADSSRLVELSKDYNTDCGQVFQWGFKTNLISFDSSHFSFMKVDKVYLEFLKADGAINIVVSGTKKNKAFDKLKSFGVAAASSSSAGYDYELYDEAIFDWSDIIPIIKTSAQTKKVVKVGKTLNNVQIAINGNSLTDFTLSVISILGRVKRVGDPSKWKK
jgi:hypothetical protein